MTVRGRYIALEGWEGSGKSTQAELLAASRDAVLTREPGGTELGASLRGLLLHADGDTAPTDRAEALMFAADRAQHVAHVIAPALAAGRDVVTDRSYGSTLAYQGYGRGLPQEELRTLIDWASQRPRSVTGLPEIVLPDVVLPDIVVLLDMPMTAADTRVHQLDRITGDQMSLLEAGSTPERSGDLRPDNIESEAVQFALRVWRGYQRLCDAEPQRWIRVDATGSIDAVTRRVADAVDNHPAMKA